MKSEIALRSEAMKILTKNLGKVDAERFISSIKKINLIILNGERIYGKIKQLKKFMNQVDNMKKIILQKNSY